MNVWEGKSVFGGIAIGSVALFEKEEDLVKRYSIEDVKRKRNVLKTQKRKPKKNLRVFMKRH